MASRQPAAAGNEDGLTVLRPRGTGRGDVRRGAPRKAVIDFKRNVHSGHERVNVLCKSGSTSSSWGASRTPQGLTGVSPEARLPRASVMDVDGADALPVPTVAAACEIDFASEACAAVRRISALLRLELVFSRRQPASRSPRTRTRNWCSARGIPRCARTGPGWRASRPRPAGRWPRWLLGQRRGRRAAWPRARARRQGFVRR